MRAFLLTVRGGLRLSHSTRAYELQRIAVERLDTSDLWQMQTISSPALTVLKTSGHQAAISVIRERTRGREIDVVFVLEEIHKKIKNKVPFSKKMSEQTSDYFLRF